MPDEQQEQAWGSLWQCLGRLQDAAARLRRLSQQEPLLQARPDYPRARIGSSHADEVRDVLNETVQGLTAIRRLLPVALPRVPAPAGEAAPYGAGRPPGVAADESLGEIAARAEALLRMATSLQQEAFQPPPPLPPHAPPYLALSEPPGHELAGTKAVLLSLGLESVVAALRNALLGAVNRGRGDGRDPGRGGSAP